MNSTVLDEIEELRLELQKIASDKDLTDSVVIQVSQRLDVLINQFYHGQGTKRTICKKGER